MNVLTLCEKVAETKEQLVDYTNRKKSCESDLEYINNKLESLKETLRGYIGQLQEGVHYDIDDLDDLDDLIEPIE